MRHINHLQLITEVTGNGSDLFVFTVGGLLARIPVAVAATATQDPIGALGRYVCYCCRPQVEGYHSENETPFKEPENPIHCLQYCRYSSLILILILILELQQQQRPLTCPAGFECSKEAG